MSSQAGASVYFEPAINAISGGEYRLGITGSKGIFGANFDLSIYKIFKKKLTIGVQGKQDLLIYTLQNREDTTNVSGMGTNLGARIGFIFPGFHIWYVHGVVSSLRERYLESEEDVSVSYTGDGFGIGMSFWSANSLSLTISVSEYYYKDYTISGVFPRVGSFENRHLRMTYATIGFGMPLGQSI